MRRDGRTRVIVGVHDSLAGLRALRLAVAEARRRGAVLHAVRAWNFNPAWRAAPERWTQELEQEAADIVTQAFEAAMGGLPTDLDVVTATVLGAPGTVLVEYAYRDDDLLFVGTRQRGWLRRSVHRSEARYCLARATCPVVVVPPDAFARAAEREGLQRAIRHDLAVLAG